jgi:hypothetical protein
MRRSLRSAVAVGAMVAAALAVVPAAAQAAPAAAEASTSWHVQAPFVKYGTYSTYAECTEVGANGEFHGRWLAWQCARSLAGWELWVQYS